MGWPGNVQRTVPWSDIDAGLVAPPPEYNAWLAAHDAELRESIAKEIEAEHHTLDPMDDSEYTAGVDHGFARAARIARGKE